MREKGGEATLDSGEGGPYLCSYQEESFRQEDDADGPRNLKSCLAETRSIQLEFDLHECII
ncbi:MAG: hypothetical protein K0Q53_727 [Massilibacillus sp.]|nr:hypothetical protein [Massilibacillus sp.]